MKVAVIFDRFGPYHIARLEAAAKYMEIVPIEISGESKEYQWDRVNSSILVNRITLFDKTDSYNIQPATLQKTIMERLDTLKPDVVAVNGWYDRSALIALFWCIENNIPAVVMSESAAGDEKRIWWKEKIKQKLVQQFSAGLVGGERHADYLSELGMNANDIFKGYDVIDNNYFEQNADKARAQKALLREKMGLPENYFLMVSRFVEKKNIPFVIKAYNDYYQADPKNAWPLMILGDGSLKPNYLQLIEELGLQKQIIFEGFKQYSELPIYFGLASVFIHASTTEQWGLVVNEAMASGLPVIISERCGCVPELVKSGLNGFAINPNNQAELTEKMRFLSTNCQKKKEMGQASRKIVATLNPDSFGKGLFNASATALKVRRRRSKVGVKLILKSLIHR